MDAPSSVLPVHKWESYHCKVPFSQIEKTEKNIEKKYDVSRFEYLFKVCAAEQRNDILLRIASVSVHNLLTYGIVGGITCGTIGMAVGYAAVAREPKKDQTLPVRYGIIGATYGTCLGMSAGALIDGAREYIQIKQSTQFNEWKNGLTKEKYDLFLNCIKNYTEDNDFGDFLCAITLDIPTVPVRCPNVKGRVYEKAVIEEHLETQWKIVKIYKDSGYSKEKIAEFKRNVCPFHGKHYKKEDLVYASDFAKKAIFMLKEIKSSLNIAPNHDPILLEGLDALLQSYKANHTAISDEAISSLTRQALEFGATEDQRRNLVRVFRAHFDGANR